jgi:hypothetical protein
MVPLFAAADAIYDQEAASPVDRPTVDVITDPNGLRAGLTRRLAERYAISGSTSSLSGPRPKTLSRWESLTREVHTGRSYGHL